MKLEFLGTRSNIYLQNYMS